ncbi:DUF1801 domain-containing protein [Cecembia rubra]|uniref:DUF1801 domain-containing protein n=1 Tax=Cecembia rubra TaxID=1485585 RepID=UPI00271509FC|nr:DUF1801 domain-containing protein [Cecembia rubra]
MATKNKTVETDQSVKDFINSFVEKEQKRQDSFRLIDLMREWSGFDPKMWGSSIIGFGTYHYKYASGHEGDAPLLGFSPRKAAFSLYVIAQGNDNQKFLDKLGKYKMGKACIYFKSLDELNLSVLEKLCKSTVQYLNQREGKVGC